jgi:hypothetical protein
LGFTLGWNYWFKVRDIPNLKLKSLRRSAVLKLGGIPGTEFQIIGLANEVFSTSSSLLTT